jgi:hypothetical protein
VKVSIEFEFDDDDDGYNGFSASSREGVIDLYTMAQFLTDAIQGAGWGYVVDVGFEKDDGNITFGKF